MIEETAAKKASYAAREKVNDLWKVWINEYPTTVDQTFYNLVLGQIEALRTLIRLAGEVEE
jgi:hypothetical protein